jgi:hypothetical protein
MNSSLPSNAACVPASSSARAPPLLGTSLTVSAPASPAAAPPAPSDPALLALDEPVAELVGFGEFSGGEFSGGDKVPVDGVAADAVAAVVLTALLVTAAGEVGTEVAAELGSLTGALGPPPSHAAKIPSSSANETEPLAVGQPDSRNCALIVEPRFHVFVRGNRARIVPSTLAVRVRKSTDFAAVGTGVNPAARGASASAPSRSLRVC